MLNEAARFLRTAHNRWPLALMPSDWATAYAWPIALSLALVAIVTVCLSAVGPLIDLDHAAFGYLLPVIVAATRWGFLTAVVSAVAGLAASAFFFYAPLYDFRVANPTHIADLILFSIVAVVTVQLCNTVREHERTARERSEEMKALYFFSRRLAAASGQAEIYTAIQDHLSAITGCPVVFFPIGAAAGGRLAEGPWNRVPEAVRRAVAACDGERETAIDPVVDPGTGANWLIRPLSQRNSAVGILAIELGRVSRKEVDALRQRIDAALSEATATLERIDVARALGEAKLRTEAETLREALIGSLSHDLRTPLASILGSASILAQAPELARNQRLSELVDVVREEALRLNSDIQNLLDAGRISSSGVQPHLAWAEPLDIVNASLERQRARLAAHKLRLDLEEDLPLVRVDAPLVEQALSQVISNAVKYSRPGSTITIAARRARDRVLIAVSDEGAGISEEEKSRLFERFYRSGRHHASVPGSGLGLWIARAFMVASGGDVYASSEGENRGTTITLSLPVPSEPVPAALGGGDG
jgi:two-component system sensor histidine kinase KdpD